MSNFDIESVFLESGAHEPNGKFCVMELSAKLAGEEWSDHPKCVSTVIGAFCRSWNDSLNDVDRQKLKPYAVKVLNTKGTPEQEEFRAWLATDWLCRTLLPEFLSLNESLKQHAEAVSSSDEVLDIKSAKEIKPKLAAARAAAWDAARDAACAAAWAAAWAAARDAAWAAAWTAAWAAAGAAAWAAARDAARDADWDAARDAAWAALKPTVDKLQESAFNLLDRMIAITAKEESNVSN